MHVSRNDFRPPPQVESSVIRLVPLDPPPPVKFEEFDGLNRIIFSRPNKTVRGNFQAKGVMKMLEQNRKTWLSMQEMVSFHAMRDPFRDYVFSLRSRVFPIWFNPRGPTGSHSMSFPVTR